MFYISLFLRRLVYTIHNGSRAVFQVEVPDPRVKILAVDGRAIKRWDIMEAKPDADAAAKRVADDDSDEEGPGNDDEKKEEKKEEKKREEEKKAKAEEEKAPLLVRKQETGEEKKEEQKGEKEKESEKEREEKPKGGSRVIRIHLETAVEDKYEVTIVSGCHLFVSVRVSWITLILHCHLRSPPPFALCIASRLYVRFLVLLRMLV